ncbi:MAG: inositol monophosphatase [Bdellovibrionales bacterium]
MKSQLEMARVLAREMAAMARSSSQKTVLFQEGRDIKLELDQALDQYAHTWLKERSEFPVFSEERHKGLKRPDSYHWIVDPLDGSYNWHREQKNAAISIAFCKGSDPLLGVVRNIETQEEFRGIINDNAWCNDQRLQVSNRSQNQGTLMTGIPSHSSLPEVVSSFARQVSQFKKIRMWGCASLSLCQVARGQAEAYYEYGIRMWDVAAGVAIVRAAGGQVDMKCLNETDDSWEVSAQNSK